MTKVKIFGGICGFTTEVEVEKLKKKQVSLKVVTECPNWQKFVNALEESYDGMAFCIAKPGKSPLYDIVEAHLPVHAGCVVANGILKAIEAECGLALKKDCSITFVE